MGGVLDGLPSRVKIDLKAVQAFVDRRRPGVDSRTSPRREKDRVELLSGISRDGLTLGAPIGVLIRCAGSASLAAGNSGEGAMQKGDSTGGIVHGVINGLPVGIGEPVFDKLHARLGYAMMSIPAAKGFDIGFGVGMASMFGSEAMDGMNPDGTFRSNYSGGVLGGISNGMPVEFSVFFKPTSSIMQPRPGVTLDGKPCVIPPKGRHDPCVAIRAVPVVEAMAWLVVADLMRMS